MTRLTGGWAGAAAAALFASTLALTLPASADADPGTEKVSVSTGGVPGNGTSHGVDVSADGSVVAFGSAATNLLPGGTSTFDIYVRDRDAGTRRRRPGVRPSPRDRGDRAREPVLVRRSGQSHRQRAQHLG